MTCSTHGATAACPLGSALGEHSKFFVLQMFALNERIKPACGVLALLSLLGSGSSRRDVEKAIALVGDVNFEAFSL